MRTILKCTVGFVFALYLFAQNSGDEAAVKEIVQKYMDARDQQDETH